VQVIGKGIDTEIAARVNASELGSSGRVYWEGPVASRDEGVIGYLEMTGYAGKLEI
jgi:predicted secreted hydrolase